MVKRWGDTVNEQLQQHADWASTRAFLNVLCLRNKETAIHSILVSDIAVKIGTALKISCNQLVDLYTGALLHDIGKLAVPDAILCKPTKLNASERDVIMQHPVTGYKLIGRTDYLNAVPYVVLGHHERYDGLGYPLGLKGEDIHLLARICAVADTLAAMIIDRPYRQKVSISAALDEVQRCSGTQFDPKIVDILSLLDMENIVAIDSICANDCAIRLLIEH